MSKIHPIVQFHVIFVGYTLIPDQQNNVTAISTITYARAL